MLIIGYDIIKYNLNTVALKILKFVPKIDHTKTEALQDM